MTAYHVALWARLPWDVLVTRQVVATRPVPADLTLRAGELLDLLDCGEFPTGRDAQWQWPLPPSVGAVLDHIPAGELRRVGLAATRTVREAAGSGVGGRPVGSRVLRDTLLDHVPIVVQASGQRVEVPQRLVQGVLRMGFLGSMDAHASAAPVAVRAVASWVGLAAEYGSAWRQVRRALAVAAIR
jgi:hypothetical protein